MRFLRPLTLLIMLLSFCEITHAFQLSSDLQELIDKKKFLNPTSYYSSPDMFFAKELISPSEIESILQKKFYRTRNSGQSLSEKDYFVGNETFCNQFFKSATCLSFKNADGKIYNLIFSNGAIDKIYSTTTGATFDETPWAETDPELVASYIGTEPILHEQVKLGEVPPVCLNAIMAIEDNRFLEHHGVSFTSILRAMSKNIVSGHVAQGGSTLTQQLVKNKYLTADRTFKRKFKEFFLALMIESQLTKDQILEAYINTIYLGQNGAFQVRGYGAASHHYFNKGTLELQLPECALLAAIINSPGIYNPFKHPEKATSRRNLVLKKMFELKLISQSEFDETTKKPLGVTTPNLLLETAPYYIDAVRRSLKQINIETDENSIYTGLDLEQQKAAQSAVNSYLSRLEIENIRLKKQQEKGLKLQGVLIASDLRTSLVTAAVGGRDYKQSQFNRAYDSARQMGSTAKPFVYLAALENKFKPDSLIDDSLKTYKTKPEDWTPENYERDYHGKVPLYFGLKNSLNAATVDLGFQVGLDKFSEVLRRFNLAPTSPIVPSLFLGALEKSPFEVLRAYSQIASEGEIASLGFTRKVISADHQNIFEFKSEKKTPTGDETHSLASLISMLKQTNLSGTARAIAKSNIHVTSAGKTGTTSDYKDAWYAGITPQRAAIVWVGYDHNEAHGLTGATAAVPIWIDFMSKTTARDQNIDFKLPNGSEKKSLTDYEGRTIELVF